MGSEDWWFWACDYRDITFDRVFMGCLLNSVDGDATSWHAGGKAGTTLIRLRPNLTLFLARSDPPGVGMVLLIFYAWNIGQSKSNLGKSSMLIAWPDLDRRKLLWNEERSPFSCTVKALFNVTSFILIRWVATQTIWSILWESECAVMLSWDMILILACSRWFSLTEIGMSMIYPLSSVICTLLYMSWTTLWQPARLNGARTKVWWRLVGIT